MTAPPLSAPNPETRTTADRVWSLRTVPECEKSAQMRTLLVANSGTEGTQPRTRPASAPPMRECAQPTLSAQKKRTSTAPPSPAASTGHMPGLLAREGARYFGTPDRPRCGAHVRFGISVPCRLQAGRVRKVRPFRLRLGPLELELGLPAGRSAPRLAPACPSLRGATGRRWPLRHRMCWVTGARLFCTQGASYRQCRRAQRFRWRERSPAVAAPAASHRIASHHMRTLLRRFRRSLEASARSLADRPARALAL